MNTKGMSTLEFCVIIAVVAASFLVMVPYLRQAIEGHWKGNADNFSEGQYDSKKSTEPSWYGIDKLKTKVQLVSPKLSVNVSGKQGASMDFATELGTGNYAVSSVKQAKILQMNDWGTYK